MTYMQIWQIFHRMAEMSPHGFRHSIAIKLPETGKFDKLNLLYWFGWKSFNMARAYIKRVGGRRAEKITKFMVENRKMQVNSLGVLDKLFLALLKSEASAFS